MTGIKGTGMAALAELLHKRGAIVRGSDIAEKFYTDKILDRLGIPYREDFDAANIEPGIQLVIHSAAYDPAKNPELLRAKELGIPVLVYPEALGLLSRLSDSTGIAGVHGKTTTTALVGTLLVRLGLPVSVLVGSAVSSFGDASTVSLGSKYFVAETCEYRRHFLHFDPTRVVLTSVEADHLDYFRDADDIADAFASYVERIHPGGALIYCADDPGAAAVARGLAEHRRDLTIVPYGIGAEGRFRINEISQTAGCSRFCLNGWPVTVFEIRLPGRHVVLDAAGAVALCVLLLETERGRAPESGEIAAIGEGLLGFKGSRRRSEILGEAEGVLFMDDYGHHPTAIKTTLEGLRSFYPGRRIIVDFMSHTYSRTKALLEDFATSFAASDEVILHKIYASAREVAGSVSGRDLFEATAKNHPNVHYFEEVEEALPFCRGLLAPGDLFITMGAGNNWTLSHALFKETDSGSESA
ncbi:MAG TPA: UDP-N-acetylmuramate--L-alanine ligase [Spirochaetia bacterium]|nr:UDP-N-acetylmuramate--L-alanine ligase [Spirochaetia bacterium]